MAYTNGTYGLYKCASSDFKYGRMTNGSSSNPIAGVELKSVLMRNAPTALTADYGNGKASFTMNANMEQAYKTVYSNYHTPAGTDPKQAPFRLELRYDSAVEPIHLQVYLDTEKEAFTIGDYAIAPAAYTQIGRASCRERV